jgi:hypothetical protein
LHERQGYRLPLWAGRGCGQQLTVWMSLVLRETGDPHVRLEWTSWGTRQLLVCWETPNQHTCKPAVCLLRGAREHASAVGGVMLFGLHGWGLLNYAPSWGGQDLLPAAACVFVYVLLRKAGSAGLPGSAGWGISKPTDGMWQPCGQGVCNRVATHGQCQGAAWWCWLCVQAPGRQRQHVAGAVSNNSSQLAGPPVCQHGVLTPGW